MKKTKSLIIFVLLGLTGFAAAEPWQRLTVRPADGDVVVTIPDGKILEFMKTFSRPVNGTISVGLDFGDGIDLISSNTSDIQPDDRYVGPLTMTLRVTGFGTGHLTTMFRIRENPGDLRALPNNALVIPEDGAGPVDIILESSTNLTDWVSANPGQYATSSTRRYFRLRAVQN